MAATVAESPINEFKKLVVIVGQTASGKSSLALDLATKFNGEIICADSRTVYRGMDVGTAKPTKLDQAKVPHYLLDIINPDQSFSVSDFKILADKVIRDIHSRGKLPILVGGSGLYIDSVIYNFNFRPANRLLREQFADSSAEDLRQELRERKIPIPENKNNIRYLLRSLEAGKEPPKNKDIRANTLMIGLDVDKQTLRQRSSVRAENMLQIGLREEVNRLVRSFGWTTPAMQTPAYSAFHDHPENDYSMDLLVGSIVDGDLKLAKKQRTWFRRNKSIQWITDPSKAVELLTTFLNK